MIGIGDSITSEIRLEFDFLLACVFFGIGTTAFLRLVNLDLTFILQILSTLQSSNYLFAESILSIRCYNLRMGRLADRLIFVPPHSAKEIHYPFSKGYNKQI